MKYTPMLAHPPQEGLVIVKRRTSSTAMPGISREDRMAGRM